MSERNDLYTGQETWQPALNLRGNSIGAGELVFAQLLESIARTPFGVWWRNTPQIPIFGASQASVSLRAWDLPG